MSLESTPRGERRETLLMLISVREGDHLLLGFTSYEIAELIHELTIM